MTLTSPLPSEEGQERGHKFLAPLIQHAKHFLTALAITVMVILTSAQASAAVGDWQVYPELQARLIASSNQNFGLQVQLSAGWEMYWRTPGEAGVAPQFDWSKSQNLKLASVLWPAPREFTMLGIKSAGYKDEVVLPIKIEPEDAGKTVTLTGDISLLVCKEICVPRSFTLSAQSDIGNADADRLISEYTKRVPKAVGAEIVTMAMLSKDAKSLHVMLRVIKGQQGFTNPRAFLEIPEDKVLIVPDVKVQKSGSELLIEAQSPAADYRFSETKSVMLIITDNETAIEIPITIMSTSGDAAHEQEHAMPMGGWEDKLKQFFALDKLEAQASSSVLFIMLVAFLGGLVLNLMPCVFPVLSLKILGVVHQGSECRKKVRVGFLASVAGIIASFWGLAVLVAVVKAFGGMAGWGMQFHHPAFLIFLIAVVTAFAFNLCGFFHIPMFRPAANFFARFNNGSSNRLHKNFMGGAFSTLLATPCSAPFLGTAVSFAMARGYAEIALVFTMLGIGFSMPYWLIAAFPSLAVFLPKPGLWMRKFSVFMGGILFLTVIWLLFMLDSVAGRTVSISAGMVILSASLLLCRLKFLPPTTKLGDVLTGVVVALPLLGAVALGVGHAAQPITIKAADNWSAFDENKIAKAIAEGKIVFVDVTADWCVTCKFNEKFVFNSAKLSPVLFDNSKVLAMKADWTRGDREISRYMKSLGRYGVPTYVVYGTNAKEGIVLPEVVTTSSILDAFGGASN